MGSALIVSFAMHVALSAAQPSFAVTIVPEVNTRAEASLASKKVHRVDAQLSILSVVSQSETPATMRVLGEEHTQRWYQVKLAPPLAAKPVNAWLYGAFVQLFESRKAAEDFVSGARAHLEQYEGQPLNGLPGAYPIAVTIAPEVNSRAGPTVKSEKVQQIKASLSVFEVLETSAAPVPLRALHEKHEAYWYRLSLDGDTSAWVYGAFVRLFHSKKNAEAFIAANHTFLEQTRGYSLVCEGVQGYVDEPRTQFTFREDGGVKLFRQAQEVCDGAPALHGKLRVIVDPFGAEVRLFGTYNSEDEVCEYDENEEADCYTVKDRGGWQRSFKLKKKASAFDSLNRHPCRWMTPEQRLSVGLY